MVVAKEGGKKQNIQKTDISKSQKHKTQHTQIKMPIVSDGDPNQLLGKVLSRCMWLKVEDSLRNLHEAGVPVGTELAKRLGKEDGYPEVEPAEERAEGEPMSDKWKKWMLEEMWLMCLSREAWKKVVRERGWEQAYDAAEEANG